MGIIYIFNKIPKTFLWNFIKYIYNYRLFTFYTKFKQNNACPICFTAAAGTGISQDLKKFKIIIFYFFFTKFTIFTFFIKKISPDQVKPHCPVFFTADPRRG